MEEGVSGFMKESSTEELSMLKKINRHFQIGEVDVRRYSPLALAFIGDDVYDMVVRTVVVERGNRPVNELHRICSGLVKAGTQAEMAEAIRELLSEEEEAVYKRGRNASPHTTAKNASAKDYHRATGLEALFGYLYLQDKMERILELVTEGLARTGKSL